MSTENYTEYILQEDNWTNNYHYEARECNYGKAIWLRYLQFRNLLLVWVQMLSNSYSTCSSVPVMIIILNIKLENVKIKVDIENTSV